MTHVTNLTKLAAPGSHHLAVLFLDSRPLLDERRHVIESCGAVVDARGRAFVLVELQQPTKSCCDPKTRAQLKRSTA